MLFILFTFSLLVTDNSGDNSDGKVHKSSIR